jgi:hypothetical protein
MTTETIAANKRNEIARVLEGHQIEYVGEEEGWLCGCDDRGELPHMPYRSDAEGHQADVIVAMLDKPRPVACLRCDGCGQLADTDARESWTSWTSLPLQSSAAVLMGLVKPIPCDACDGTGKASA